MAVLCRVLATLDNSEEQVEDVLNISPSQLWNVLKTNKTQIIKKNSVLKKVCHLSPAAHQQQQRKHKVEESDLQLLLTNNDDDDNNDNDNDDDDDG